jgi:hypothetical protein
MQVRRFLALSVVTLFVSAALPALAQRSNDASKQPTRSAQEQQDVQALVQTVEVALLSDLGIQVPAPGAPPPQTPPTAKPLTLGAPDSSQGEVPIKWESNHFVKGQTDTYIPFTLVLDRASVPSGAAIWIRVVNVEQAAAFATALTTPPAKPQGNNRNAPAPVRTTFAWDNGSFVDVPASCRERSNSGPDSTWPTSPSRRRAPLRPETRGTIGTTIATLPRRLPPLPEKSVSFDMRSPFPTSVSPI